MVYGKATVSMLSFDDSLCIRTVCRYRYGQFVAIGTDSQSLQVRTDCHLRYEVCRFRYGQFVTSGAGSQQLQVWTGQIVVLGTKFVAPGTPGTESLLLEVRGVTSYRYGQIVALGTNNLLLLVREVTSYRYGQLITLGTDSQWLQVRTVSRFRYAHLIVLGTDSQSLQVLTVSRFRYGQLVAFGTDGQSLQVRTISRCKYGQDSQRTTGQSSGTPDVIIVFTQRE